MQFISRCERTIPKEDKVSGQRSKTQKTTGALLSFPSNIAGNPTVIGDGS